MLDKKIVTFSSAEDPIGRSLNLVGATIVVDESDPIGVHIAARNLAADFGRVTRSNPNPFAVYKDGQNDTDLGTSNAVIIGCIESSRLLQNLQRDGKLNVESIRGKWESFTTIIVDGPFAGCQKALANFMWPAMWPGYPNPGASFFTDDPDNAKVADDYGIVVSTSHHEPMQRATNEWFAENPDGSWDWLTNKEKITDFFDQGVKRAKGRESYFTLGMRGEYDKGMKTDDPTAVVRDVIRTQRSIIKDVHGGEDSVPQSS
ncbi:hypothetical protein CCHL11_09481 [Colletotrichum chlorophyti]|uniref:Uncharacterized protein n=1 Tax=Colletotrichum chlorophyti TaxID=708187 RepID=A0A1Q8RX01_9PEZI|nr:hypothetical protein CCHL11_09481 [Colletotrichum chlorophyti]